jgi:hypothetical protein
MLESADFVGAPQLDFAAWRTFLRLSCGDQPEVIDPPPLLVGCAPQRVRARRGCDEDQMRVRDNGSWSQCPINHQLHSRAAA